MTLNNFRKHPAWHLQVLVLGFIVICIVFGLSIQPVEEIFEGLKKIVIAKCPLITDYYLVGGMGATLVNVSLVVLIAFIFHKIARAEWNGFSLAVFFIVAGFSFFGKNILNVLPLIFGNFIYTKAFKQKYAETVKIGLLSTCLAPLVSESYYIFDNHIAIQLAFATFMGILAGMIIPMMAKFAIRCHMGLQLYNVGFAAGIVGMGIIAVFNFSGYQVGVSISPPNYQYHNLTLLFISIVLLYFFLLSLLINPKAYKEFIHLIRLQTQYGCDYVKKLGSSVAILNMVICGVFYLLLLLVLKINICGASIGALCSVIGFSAFGKNIFNTGFITIGVVGLTFLEGNDISDVRIVLALLFGTTLAPISNRYGPFFGILAGALHVCLVRNLSGLHSGLNLYNNGFSAGMVCVFLIPICECLQERFPNAWCFINIKYLDDNKKTAK